MEKIPTLFKRNWDTKDHPIINEIDPRCKWVLDGEGTPTKKWDGTAVLVKDGKMYKRYDRLIKKGKDKGKWRPEPQGWISCELDEVTKHWFGWVPVDFNDPADWMHAEAWKNDGTGIEDGTYELCGPSMEGNREKLDKYVLIPHGKEILDFEFNNKENAWEELKEYLSTHDIEGIVWWHKKDNRRAKIKAVDFKVGRALSNPGSSGDS